MEWKDEGIVLAVRRHGETGAIAEILTATRGRSLGLIRGGRSRRMRPVLQPGNIVLATWRARLEEHLGNFMVEPLELKAGLLMSLESPIARAEQMARQMLALGRLMPTAELIEKVDAVEGEQVRALAERLMAKSRLSFALAGAGKAGRGIVDNVEQRAVRH